MSDTPEIVFYFRNKVAGAFSINQIFESLAAEIGKSFTVKSLNLKRSGANVSKVFANITEARKHDVKGINHITGDVHYIALGLHKGHTVLTIHDCILLHRTPRNHPKFLVYLWLWYKLPIRMADVVTTISEKSKAELISFTGCDPQKIVVIPNFVNEIYRPALKEFNSKCPRVLHIGVNPNKNLERLAKSLAGIPCILEIIGELKTKQLEALQRHCIAFENYSNLTMAEIAERYRQSDIVVFASTYEGFGMPVVEAQATGRPVVTSNIDPMTWVAGAEGACFVNPFDTDSIRLGIQRVINDDAYRNRLIENGLKNVRRFSLSQIAEQYMEVYSRVLSTKKRTR